jgi:hypothetical protein
MVEVSLQVANESYQATSLSVTGTMQPGTCLLQPLNSNETEIRRIHQHQERYQLVRVLTPCQHTGIVYHLFHRSSNPGSIIIVRQGERQFQLLGLLQSNAGGGDSIVGSLKELFPIPVQVQFVPPGARKVELEQPFGTCSLAVACFTISPMSPPGKSPVIWNPDSKLLVTGRTLYRHAYRYGTLHREAVYL